VRALVVEHDSLSTPERVGEHLERRGVSLEPFIVVHDLENPEVDVAFPEADGYDLVVLMGAPWSVYESRVQRWVRPEMELVSHHLARGTPVLGICFGAQIMASCLGATVSRTSRPEYGWGTVESRSRDIAPGPWFQFHHDEFTLPDGAVPLAYTESGLQAFAHQRSLGVQFHPEVTPRLVSSWFEVGGDVELTEAGIDPDELVEETSRLALLTQPALEQMLDWWLEELAGG